MNWGHWLWQKDFLMRNVDNFQRFREHWLFNYDGKVSILPLFFLRRINLRLYYFKNLNSLLRSFFLFLFLPLFLALWTFEPRALFYNKLFALSKYVPDYLNNRYSHSNRKVYKHESNERLAHFKASITIHDSFSKEEQVVDGNRDSRVIHDLVPPTIFVVKGLQVQLKTEVGQLVKKQNYYLDGHTVVSEEVHC
jgi:hypothetical protein